MGKRLPVGFSAVLAAALAVAAGPAAALGLGQIQVKSEPGQPLVAEIPIISSDPAELQGLQVRLASPETFRRVGLEPPQGLVSSLRFEPALDAGGRPVIRVSSATAVQQPLLTFLVEVDWGQGRLVREYSALLDAPRTVAAPLQPPIQAATAAPTNAIVRPADPVAVAPPPAAPPAAVKPTAPENVPPAPRPETPPPSPVAAAPLPAPMAEPAERTDAYGPVKAGQTLSQIAATLDATRDYSAAQTMLALLRSNPDAFIGGNINRLKRGAILRLPQADELAKLDRSEAAAAVHAQIAQWRNTQRPVPQPAAVANTGTDAVPGRNTAATASVESKTTRGKPARTTSARLEIAPPSARSGQAAGNQAMRSGIQAGGEGEMLRQQLQETKETLAARDAEVNELKTRVAELEKLQQQQQQLLTLKDSALASAQQTLATSNRAQANPVVSTAQAAQPPAATQQPEQGGASWLFGGLALLLVALAGWWLMRRRQREEVIPRRGFDTAALAATLPVAAAQPEPVETDTSSDETVDVSSDAPVSEAPEVVQPEATPEGVPPWHGASPVAETLETTLAKEGQQLELAQAYLDLGDDDAARALLRDVLDGRDPVARATAARLLRDL